MNQLLVWVFLILPFTCLGELNDIMAHPNWQLLNPDRCGISGSDRIVGGIDAPVGAYPWIARIGYVFPLQRWKPAVFTCAGALINQRCVITAAHCVSQINNKTKPLLIRLGEHNLDSNPDCESSFCNDPYRDYLIDEYIAHKEFKLATMKHDIGLIRMQTQITFTDFIRPICVVNGRLLEKDYIGKIVEVAGWGVYNMSHMEPSKILQALKLPVLSTWRCIDEDNNYENYTIDSDQMCLGGKKGVDSCLGDSGGPVMKIESSDNGSAPRYYLLAVVSFGLGDCGNEDIPGIYTDLSKYILWVLDHRRA